MTFLLYKTIDTDGTYMQFVIIVIYLFIPISLKGNIAEHEWLHHDTNDHSNP
jgi:hypothetical protein